MTLIHPCRTVPHRTMQNHFTVISCISITTFSYGDCRNWLWWYQIWYKF